MIVDCAEWGLVRSIYCVKETGGGGDQATLYIDGVVLLTGGRSGRHRLNSVIEML